MKASNAPALTVHVIPPHPLAPDDRWMASFPMRAYMEYGAYRSAPGSARGLVRNALEEWNLGAFEEKASLVVTELMTNSSAPRGALSYPRHSWDELKGGSWA